MRCRPSNGFLLPEALVDALSGAAGEAAQILLLYPLDTIKVRPRTSCCPPRDGSDAPLLAQQVRCQALSQPSMQVLQSMLETARATGGAPSFLRALYAGAGGAALASVAIGACRKPS